VKRILILFTFLFLCTGCVQKKIHIYADDEIEGFDKVLADVGNGNTKAYDLRSYDGCTAERIPGFVCIRTKDTGGNEKSLDTVVSDLGWKLGKRYGYLIILSDANGEEASYVAGKLFEMGYYNVHYFRSGYSRYKELKGNSFVPETGECDICG
jgi:hypothetical protein